MIPGIDVSHVQKDIDWLTTKKAGFRFAFYQATEFLPGISKPLIDPQLRNNAAGTASHRIHAAPVHAFSSRVPGKTQAEAFVAAVRDLPFSLAPVVSLRGRGGCPPDGEQLLAFLLRVERAFKCKPIILTSARCWRSLDDASPFAGFPLWLSQRGFSLPKPLFPFPMASFWQYAASGKIPGSVQPCGLDYFMGDEIGLLPFLCLNRYNDNNPPPWVKGWLYEHF